MGIKRKIMSKEKEAWEQRYLELRISRMG